ncbi:MAG: lamin tail domain-containing protein [Saprospiraceae bacterium]|nr:lamin tail domain-containing protein [Saprospiraceae bacterium]
MKNFLLFIFCLFIGGGAFGQTIFSDDFNDGDLVGWTNTADWTNPGTELKHGLSSSSGSSYINANIGAQDLTTGDYTWEFCLRNGNWDPSSTNKFWIFLIADDNDLNNTPNGYAVGVNFTGTSDDLTLYEVTNNVPSAIITSSFNWGNLDDVCIKVTRGQTGAWELLYNPNGNGEVSGGTVNNTTYTTGDNFGLSFTFTSSRAGLLWMDDVNITKSSPTPTIILSTISGNTNESGTQATFDVTLNIQPATDVVIDVTSGDLTENTVSPTTLTFTNSNYNVAQTVTVTGVDDALLDGNQTTVITVAVDDAASDDNYDGLSETIDVINEDNEVHPLVINEVLADPDGTTGDANGDGDVDISEDEFVELFNTGITSLDISGYTLSDALQVRHIFPASTIIPAGEPITIFGGGTPMGIAGIVQTASTNLIGMNNGGDDVIIKDGGGVIVVSFSYGSEGGDNESLARNPDFNGAFVKHSTIVSNNVDFSPGSLNEGTGGLPIELLHFSAVSKNQTIHLTWSTASEINNAYFDVQRSTDGRDFETIGTVEGIGTASNVQEYSFMDERPVNGFNYYRLHQVDFDGKFENSNIVTAKLSHSNDDIFLTPNPTSNVILIQTKTPFERDADFQILNMQGQVVLSSILQEGTDNLEVNVSNFPVGIYYLQLFVDNEVMMKKIIKH